MKKGILPLALAALLALSGCSGRPATLGDAGGETPPAVAGEGAVKTGLSVTTSLGSSKSATPEGDGTAQTDVTVVAVNVNEEGVITACAIDAVQAKMSFSAAGEITGDLSDPILSKNELGTDYGMGTVSSIGREWDEQAAALAAYVVGKTADEVAGIAVVEGGKAGDADLAASVTIAIGGYLPAIQAAAENAAYLGARNGDDLRIVTTGSFSAPEAGEGEAGAVQADVNIAAATMSGETITSCVIDAVQAKVAFDAAGQIVTDTAAPVLSKNQLGTDYGMGAISSIGREWDEQAAAFAAYVVGKTPAEVRGIAVTEGGKAGDADLAASVTIAIGGFQTLLGKLAA